MKAMSDQRQAKIGVLALQGDYERHAHQLRLIGAVPAEVRTAEGLESVEALIMPGGESTTMNILLDRFELREPLLAFGRSKPVWGTCAGMILLGTHIEDNQAGVKPLGLIDIDVVRNGYGRQVFSFEDSLAATLNGSAVMISGTFIRAPRVTRAGDGVRVLAKYQESPVLVEQGYIMASSFHTELDDDTTLLRYFLRNFLR